LDFYLWISFFLHGFHQLHFLLPSIMSTNQKKQPHDWPQSYWDKQMKKVYALYHQLGQEAACVAEAKTLLADDACPRSTRISCYLLVGYCSDDWFECQEAIHGVEGEVYNGRLLLTQLGIKDPDVEELLGCIERDLAQIKKSQLRPENIPDGVDPYSPEMQIADDSKELIEAELATYEQENSLRTNRSVKSVRVLSSTIVDRRTTGRSTRSGFPTPTDGPNLTQLRMESSKRQLRSTSQRWKPPPKIPSRW